MRRLAALAPSVLSKSDAEFVVFAVRGAAVATPSTLQDSATPHSSLKTVIRLPKTSSTIQVLKEKIFGFKQLSIEFELQFDPRPTSRPISHLKLAFVVSTVYFGNLITSTFISGCGE